MTQLVNNIEILPSSEILKTIVAPTYVLRSSVFGVVPRGKRKFVENRVITTLDKAVIKYSGPELSESDCDIWLAILNLAIKNEIFVRGNMCHLTIGIKTLLKSMGKSVGRNARHAAEKSIRRLVSASFTIRSDKHRYTGSFIPEVAFDDYTQKMKIVINVCIAELFMSNTTWINFQTRLKLRSDLSKWIHGYMITHTAGGVIHRISLEKMRECSRSEHIEMRKFKARAKKSIEEIRSIDKTFHIETHRNGVIEYSRIKRRELPRPVQETLFS